MVRFEIFPNSIRRDELICGSVPSRTSATASIPRNQELDAALGTDRAYDQALGDLRARWPKGAPEAEARWYVERLALLMQAAQLLQLAPDAIADAFIATRIEGRRGHVAGALTGLDTGAILARLGPAN